MDSKIPPVRFEHNEVDRLIASFGTKPEPEKKAQIEVDLKAQKEQFLTQERQRQAQTKENAR